MLIKEKYFDQLLKEVNKNTLEEKLKPLFNRSKGTAITNKLSKHNYEITYKDIYKNVILSNGLFCGAKDNFMCKNCKISVSCNKTDRIKYKKDALDAYSLEIKGEKR